MFHPPQDILCMITGYHSGEYLASPGGATTQLGINCPPDSHQATQPPPASLISFSGFVHGLHTSQAYYAL